MLSVLFAQTIPSPYMGLMQLSAILREHNVRVEVAIGSRRQIRRQVARVAPDAVGFSAFSFERKWVVRTASEIRADWGDRVKILVGGPLGASHPEVIDEGPIDAVLVGEGDHVIVEVMERIRQRRELAGIVNLWVRENTELVKGPVAPLVEDLDSLPFMDRDLYWRHPAVGRIPYIPMLAGRGCPFSCSYCYNNHVRAMYAGKGTYVRHRSIDGILEELHSIRTTAHGRAVWFQDDLFPHDRQFLAGFIERYDREIGLPVLVQSRFDVLDEEIVRLFAQWRSLRSVNLGIELGDEEIRKSVLKRNMSDEQILRGAALLHEHGVKFQSLNMLGLPGETLETALKTIKLNQAVRPHTVMFSLFHPLPRTELADRCEQEGLVRPGELGKTRLFAHGESPLDQAGIKALTRLHKLSLLATRAPVLTPALGALAKLPLGWMYYPIHRLTYLLNHMRFMELGPAEGVESAMTALISYHRRVD